MDQHTEQHDCRRIEPNVAERAEKRLYHTPRRLVRWGSIAELTRGGTGDVSDQDESGSSFVQPPF